MLAQAGRNGNAGGASIAHGRWAVHPLAEAEGLRGFLAPRL